MFLSFFEDSTSVKILGDWLSQADGDQGEDEEDDAENDRDHENGLLDSAAGCKNAAGILTRQAAESDPFVLHHNTCDQSDRSYNQGNIKKVNNLCLHVQPPVKINGSIIPFSPGNRQPHE